MATGYNGKNDIPEGDVDVATLDCLFTPAGYGGKAAANGRRLDFSGFQKDNPTPGEELMRRHVYESVKEKATSGENVLHRKICDLEWNMKRVLEKMAEMDRKQQILYAENILLKNECEELKKKLSTNEKVVEGNRAKVDKLRERQEVWKEEQIKEKVNFKEIMDKEFQQREEVVAKTVLKVIKERPNVVRDSVEKKKCVIIFGLKEEVLPIRNAREQHERKAVEEIMETIC